MDLTQIIIDAIFNQPFITHLITSLDPHITAGIIAVLSVLLVVSEVLVKIPGPYNALWQIGIAIVKTILRALKVIPTPTPEKSELQKRIDASQASSDAAGDKMRQALDENSKQRSQDLLGQ